LRRDFSLGEGFLDHRQEPLDVVARGELRHDAAVAAMKLNLAENPVRPKSLVAVEDRDRGFVTGSFDAKD
jgi:hypothetical protein